MSASPEESVPVGERRKCVVCGAVLPPEEFPLREKSTGSRRSHCKACKAAYQQDWYRRDRDRHIANAFVNKDAQRTADQKLVASAKSTPCADCGLRYPPYVMDFDHVHGNKEGTISRMVHHPVSTVVLLAEIQKCEVVCANCHRERTWGWRGGRPRTE